MERHLPLCLVTDREACKGRELEWVVRQAVLGGVTMVQLREKSLSTRKFIELALLLKGMLKPLNVPLVINDRVDVALAVDADGVHVGQSDMPIPLLHQLLPKGKIIGLSAETEADVLEANAFELTYLAVSPLYATASKTDTAPPWGLQGLAWVKAHSKHPLLVIGGVDPPTATQCASLGASGVAVISAICSAQSPKEAAESLMVALDKGIEARKLN
ncbi:thiamine-phosphate pyrophosphorylase [Dyadobacter jejuensis]|uniref:Thiamine-phosphate synthase n=1 Tax=Dyadobacter jejuensis TaxID=1082580 RepID=A0A316A944_9BACT|nr:thiamine phosphate synthase [Dyadobacter jejuensis]PWJ54275.1 thiamine-phosphate pyrophosphorylase [Dyadobacter jejuensis]